MGSEQHNSACIEGAVTEAGTVDSIFALRDVRHRLVRAQREGERLPLAELLEMDPLSIIRLLRISRAPLNQFADRIRSIPELLTAFGGIKVKRALEVRTVPSRGTERARALWLHALATAHACRELAAGHAHLDGEVAYLQGLLVDLHDWRPMLTEFQGDRRELFGRLLGPWLAQATDRAECRSKAVHTNHQECHQLEDLVAKGELLANLAGFHHPDEDTSNQETLLTEVSRQDLVAAQNLRTRVWNRLDAAGLRGTEHCQELGDEDIEELELHEWRRETGSLADAVISLQNCSAALRYRGIITATTAASLRFLDYERAVLAVWNPKLACCWMRAKADMSPRPLEPFQVRPNDHELRLLNVATELGVATRMEPGPGGYADGILEALGVDEVVCVPINPTFATPSFLFLDRTLTRRPVIAGDDRKSVTALASTASFLTENLFLKKTGERAKRFALTDPLTRLFNRGVGLGTLEREIARAHRVGTPLTVMMMDLDEFKNLNDKLGHLRGDAALRVSAEVLRRTLRKQDTICRYGGEEFMVVLPDTSVEQASITATRVFTEIEAAGKRNELPLTVSIGLTPVGPEDNVESILTRADHALYASKARGRNRFSVDSVS